MIEIIPENINEHIPVRSQIRSSKNNEEKIMTQLNAYSAESSMSIDENPVSLMLPRDSKIQNPCQMYVPQKLQIPPFTIDTDKFDALQKIVNFNPSADENIPKEHSALYETVSQSFNIGKDQKLQEHIVRKYLLKAQQYFHELTNDPILLKIGCLHGDLLDLSTKLSEFKNQQLEDFCAMLQGEVYDLYSSTVSQTCKSSYWNQGLQADECIKNFLEKELMNLRVTPLSNIMILSKALIRRSLDGAPEADKQIIRDWASKEHISYKR